MPLIVLTRELAFAVNLDAGNAAMDKAGRTAWNADDAEVARLEFNRLWPLCEHNIEPGECWVCGQQTQPVENLSSPTQQ